MNKITGVKFMPDTVTAVANEDGVFLYVLFDDVEENPVVLSEWEVVITPVIEYIHRRTSRMVENAPFTLKRVMFTQGSRRSLYSPMMALLNSADKCYQWQMDHVSNWVYDYPKILEELKGESLYPVLNMPKTQETSCIGVFNKYFGIQEYSDHQTPLKALLDAAGVDVAEYQNHYPFMKMLQATIEALLVRELALIYEEKEAEIREHKLQDIAAAFLPGDIDEHVADLLVELGESIVARMASTEASEEEIEEARKFIDRFKQ